MLFGFYIVCVCVCVVIAAPLYIACCPIVLEGYICVNNRHKEMLDYYLLSKNC
jgi:hypothetical protein